MPSSSIKVGFIRAFRDNYIWTIESGKQVVLVDPGDATPVLNAFKQRKLKLAAILLTHKHNDHIGGVADLLKKASVPVYGPANDDIESVTHPLKEGDVITLDAVGGLQISVLDVPGHTKGHIAYYASAQKLLFCGDLLFGAGCGRIFEGTPEQMYASVNKIAALPDDVQIYAGHEYTLSNLKFAQEIEPDNTDISTRIKADNEKRKKYLPTLPSTLAEEKATNPFLRADQETVIARMEILGKLENKSPSGCFAAIRAWKDTYVA